MVEITQYALNQRSPAEGKGKGQKLSARFNRIVCFFYCRISPKKRRLNTFDNKQAR